MFALCNPCALAESQEHARKLCSATLINDTLITQSVVCMNCMGIYYMAVTHKDLDRLHFAVKKLQTKMQNH